MVMDGNAGDPEIARRCPAWPQCLALPAWLLSRSLGGFGPRGVLPPDAPWRDRDAASDCQRWPALSRVRLRGMRLPFSGAPSPPISTRGAQPQ